MMNTTYFSVKALRGAFRCLSLCVMIYDVHPIVICYISTMLPGSDKDSVDLDEPEDSSRTGSINLDPFDYVYLNLPESTHILKHAANCEHCHAKKFQYETDAFFCQNGKIDLGEPEPIPELMRLWSSADANSRHFRESIRFFNGHSPSQPLASV